MVRRLLVAASLTFALAFTISVSHGPAQLETRSVPSRLSDQEFWRLSSESSEPNGYFRSENLTSNEMLYQTVIPELVRRTKPGNVYLGVGPEQNYTYITALRPSMAIIFDIRRGNLALQLMYKALFELARDRGEFVSMLFAKPRPAGISKTSTAEDLFGAFSGLPASDTIYQETLMAMEDHLTVTHHLPLAYDDLRGIEAVYQAFYRAGFAVRFSPTYADLMTATDQDGVERSYLATDANFEFMKDLESRNLVVPVVGDFGGPKAIRAIGTYLKSRGAVVSAFYLSNVEQYLYQDGKRAAVCRNVAALPLIPSSTFIRSASGGGFGRGFDFVSSLGDMMAEIKDCR
jgi:hypothetical protein